MACAAERAIQDDARFCKVVLVGSKFTLSIDYLHLRQMSAIRQNSTTSQGYVGTHALNVPIVGHEYRVSRIPVCRFLALGAMQQTRWDASSAASYRIAWQRHEPWRALEESNVIPTAGSIAEPSEILLCFRSQIPNGQPCCSSAVPVHIRLSCSLHLMAVTSIMYVFENKFVLLTERSASRRALFRRLRSLGVLSGIR